MDPRRACLSAVPLFLLFTTLASAQGTGDIVGRVTDTTAACCRPSR